ncbi:MAG: alkaline phosphatase D family protein [Gammaproteobacteria bacterium]
MNRIRRIGIGGANALYLFVLVSLAGCEGPSSESLATGAAATRPPAANGPYQATGIKIGEVTDTRAIIWTRLTREPERIGSEAPIPEFRYRAPASDELREAPPGRFHPHDWTPVVIYSEGSSLDTIEGAVRGAPGETRVLYRPAGGVDWRSTAWTAVDPERDFTRQFTLAGLAPATEYTVRIEARSPASETVGSLFDGRFRTAPLPDEPARVVFAVTTGQDYEDQDAPGGGFRMYPAIMDLEPSFFVHTGDIVYYDAWAKNIDLARWGWARMYSLPTNVEFQRQVPSYFMKDDHDTWQDDTWPTQQSTYMGDFTFQQGVDVFTEQVPMAGLTYRTFSWGQDVQIWLVEGRDYRSANPDPDGPDKTIWGTEQKAWFKETVEASDATFRILISPTPFVGPDIEGKSDSHANDAFGTEGRDLREFMTRQENMIVICGDRHWQYVSVHDATGLREYATGAASDAHAGGWLSNDDIRPEHRYLNIIGGFLSVTAERRDGTPTLTLRHHGVDGEILNEDILVAE